MTRLYSILAALLLTCAIFLQSYTEGWAQVLTHSCPSQADGDSNRTNIDTIAMVRFSTTGCVSLITQVNVVNTNFNHPGASNLIDFILNSNESSTINAVNNFNIAFNIGRLSEVRINDVPSTDDSARLLTNYTEFKVQFTFDDGVTYHFVVGVNPTGTASNGVAAHSIGAFTVQTVQAVQATADDTPTAEETQSFVGNFINTRTNNIINNQPNIVGFIDGSGGAGGGPLGNLGVTGNENSQTLAFSTSRGRILDAINNPRDVSVPHRFPGFKGEPSPGFSDRAANISERLSQPRTQLLAYAEDESASLKTANPIREVAIDGTKATEDYTANLDDRIGNRAGKWDVWTQIYGARSSAGSSDSKFWVGYVGTHYFVDDNTLIGIAGQLDWSDESNSNTGSDAEGQGWMIGPYIAGRVKGQNLFYEARAAYGQSDNDVSPDGTVKGSFDTTRWMVSGKLSGNYTMDDITITPSVAVAYFEETQDAFADSASTRIAEQTASLGEVSFGPTIARAIDLGDGASFTPHVGVSGVFNFGIKDNDTSQGFVLGNDDFRARSNAGFSYINEFGIIISVDGFYDGIGITDYEAYGGTARVTVPLN